jgi:predicted CXXCH cytochrome family protein
MSDARVPSPDFEESRYERPNKDWICGRTCDGCPCRIGPGPGGECRATTECNPQLVLKAGETKGTWKCTRPPDWGGACESGPRPDGTCCKPIPKCRPERSLRNKRGLLTRAVLAAGVAGLLIALTGPWRESFINPAPLSQHHSGPEFERVAAGRGSGAGLGCVACHSEVDQGFSRWSATAVKASRTSLAFARFTTAQPRDFSRMDAACIKCHRAQSFHQANVARGTSCSVCHLEHQGGGPLPPVASTHCTECHGEGAQMAASAALGRALPAALFAKPATPGVILFPDGRPADGLTQTITAFAGHHPEFRANLAGRRDDNPLAFNHAVHLTGNVPKLAGRPLECASCHRPDASGAFMQRISFEQHCRACHSLQFDERNPGMQLPHGDATYVRAYLRSLPAQYADHGSRQLGITGKNELRRYVEEQMLRLRDRVRTGELLEEQVFFSDARKGPAAAIAGLDGPGRAKFAGCAYCHEVTPRANAAPRVTVPAIPDRWMLHARFNHAKHTPMACTACHAAAKSRSTSDIIMPSQRTCVVCHSPKGGVRDNCTACHGYHNPPPAAVTTATLP